ncbi:MAG: NAD(+)/NADH kinase [Cellulosilyticum sp.]|nr:NAD(+)/NADH kinase [Cellulosilyticum sp.]
MRRLRHIGIIPNLMKDKDLTYTNQITSLLNKHNISPYMDREIAPKVEGNANGVEIERLYELCDCLIVIGGDGTILGTAEAASLKDIPIVGVNLGRLGFLADIELDEIEEAIERLIHGKYNIEERMMLRATIIGANGEKSIFYALNEINVTRGSFSRLVEFKITINDELSGIYPADGVLVATPTGSTAYNLSAGGPIVVPLAQSYVVTPICPHTLHSKSIVLCKEDKVCITTLEETKDMALSMDGKLQMYLTPQDVVYIERSPYVTKLVKISERKFFEILREKMFERRR